jgi:hypothetical protein
MKIAVSHQKSFQVKIVDGDIVKELSRQELVPSYRNLQGLVHSCLL